MGTSPVTVGKPSTNKSKAIEGEISSSSGCTLVDQTAKRKGSKKPPKRPISRSSEWRTAHDMIAADNTGTTSTRKTQQQTSMEEKIRVSSALAALRTKKVVHKVKQDVKQKPPKTQTLKSTVSRCRIARDMTEADNTGASAATSETDANSETGPRTQKQKTAFLRALGLAERPKYPVAGEVYRMDFSEFRQHFSNKLPLYDGRAVVTLGTYRKSRNHQLVCALHTACPFLLHTKQQVYADGWVCQEIKEVVNHTCSLQSHADISLCSANFLGYLVREDELLLETKGCRLHGVDACARAEKNFGIDFSSKARRQMFIKAVKARDEQYDDSALSAFRSPSPICVTQIPMFDFEPYAQMIAENPQPKQKHKTCPSKQSERKSDQSMRSEENRPSSLECENDSTTAKLATAFSESTASVVPLVQTTGVAENPKPRQSKCKSHQSMRSEENQPSSLECENDSRTAKVATASTESTSSVVPLVQTTGVAGNPKPRQSKRKSDQSMRSEESQPSSLECESDSTTAKLATAFAESTSSIVPIHTTGVAKNPKPEQSKRKSVSSKESSRKSDQSMRREAKRKPDYESAMDNSVARKDSVDRKKRKVLDGRSTPATNGLPRSDPAPLSTSTPNCSQRSARKSKPPEYMRLLESYTPLVDELSSRTSRPPCSTGSSTSTMNQQCGTNTNADRIQKRNILAERTPPILASRSLKPDCEESADNSLLFPALTFPPRKTRASSSKLQNTLEKQQPKKNLNQQLKNDLNPARVILGHGMTPAVEDLPPRKSAVSSDATFTDTIAANRQPDNKQNQQASSNAKQQPTRKWKSEQERLLGGTTDLRPRRSGVVSPATSIDTIAAKRQPESEQAEQSSSIATRRSTRNVKSEQERLLDGMTPVVDDLPPRRPAVSYAAIYTETSTDVAASTIVHIKLIKGKQQTFSKRVQQLSGTAKTQPVVGDLPSRKTRASYTGAASVTLSEPGTKLKEHEKPVENSMSEAGGLPSRMTRTSYTGATSVTLSEPVTKHKKPAPYVVGDLPSRRTRASYTGASSVTLSESGAKLNVKREKPGVEKWAPVVGDLPSRRTRASYTGATSVTLSEPGTKREPEHERPVENPTPALGGLPSRRMRASNTGASITLSEPGSKLELEHEKPVDNSPSGVGDLPSRRTRASRTGAASVTLSEPGTKHEKPVEKLTSAVGDLSSRRTRASYTGAATFTLSESGTKLKLEHEKLVENLTPAVGGLPSRRTRASYTGATSVTLSEPGTKLKLEYVEPVENSPSVVVDLPSRRTRASYAGDASVTLPEPGSMPDQQCRKRSHKPEHESLLQNATSFSDELVPRRSSAARSGPLSSKHCSGSNLKQQPIRKHEQEREHLLDNLTPPIYGLRSRRACASIPGDITEVYSTKDQPDNKRSQNRQQSGNKVNHVPVRTLKHGRLLDDMAPLYEDLSQRKTRSSFHSEIGSTTQPLQTNRKLEKHLSRKLRSEHATLKDNSTPVLGDLPSRKTRASSTELVSTTLHLPRKLSLQGRHADLEAKELPARKAGDEKQFEGLASLNDFRPRGSRGQFEAGQLPNHKRKREHEVLLGDCPGKKARTIVSHPKLTGGTAASRDSGPLWINPGELREADVVVAETPAQVSGPVVLFHVALVEEYRRLAARDVYEFVNFGISLASHKAAIDLKLKELNLNMDKDHGDKDIEAERVDHSRSLKEFSRLADAERLEKIRESEEDERQRLVADYHNRAKRANPMRAEESALISRPIRFEEGMEVGRRNKEPCCIGPDCTLCLKANAQDIQPKKEPLPRFRRFDMTQLDSIDESNDDAGANVARARRNRPARVGKRAASRLALSEMQHSLSFIEELNSTERTISHRLF